MVVYCEASILVMIINTGYKYQETFLQLLSIKNGDQQG